MRIFIDGADGTGKTTLAKKLAEKYRLDICHCTQDDPADYEFYKQTARKENVVWDRHTLGELVYPKIFNRTPQICIADAQLATFYARENNGKMFVLIADDKVLRKRLLERSVVEDSRILQNIEWINDRFLFFANMFDLPIIDTSKMSFAEICEMVEQPTNFNFIHK